MYKQMFSRLFDIMTFYQNKSSKFPRLGPLTSEVMGFLARHEFLSLEQASNPSQKRLVITITFEPLLHQWPQLTEMPVL